MNFKISTSICLWLLTLTVDSSGEEILESLDKINRAQPFRNITAIVRKLTEDYDVRLRPNFGGDALKIGLDIILASLDAVSEVNMDYTLTLYLNQYWQDERLSFGMEHENTTLTLGGDFAELIWVPDTFFANDKHSFLHDVTEKNKVIKLRGDGSISYGMRFTTTLACMLNLEDYPMDVQNCTVEIESYGYTMNEVMMFWIGGDNAIRGIGQIDLPQFTLKSYKTVSTVERLQTGDYQRLSLSFSLSRNIGYFIFQTYLPSILIVMLSWLSFWINHEATSARVSLGITTVLTMTTISTAVRSSLPRISYVKAIDIYLLMCFLFVFCALIEFASVNYTYWGARTRERLRRQKEQRRKARAPNEMGLERFVSLLGRPGGSAFLRRQTESNVDIVRMAEGSPERLDGSVNRSPKNRYEEACQSLPTRTPPTRHVGPPSSSEDDSLATASEGEIRDPCLSKLMTSCQGGVNIAGSTTEGYARQSPLPGIGDGAIIESNLAENDQTPVSIRHFTNTMTPDEVPSVRICSTVYGPGANVCFSRRNNRRRFWFFNSHPKFGRPKRRSSRRTGNNAPGVDISQSFRIAGNMARNLVRRQFVPSVQDVSKIDRISRVMFPALFVVFNIAYWSLYLFGGIRHNDGHKHLFD